MLLKVIAFLVVRAQMMRSRMIHVSIHQCTPVVSRQWSRCLILGGGAGLIVRRLSPLGSPQCVTEPFSGELLLL